MLIRHVVLASRSRRRRRYRKVHHGPALATLTECQRQLGIRRRVELFVTECHTVPALAGLFRPRILVSERTLAMLNADQLAWLFRHELAHVRHGDIAIQYLWRWARVIHWFNPTVWWAAARARVEAELACDESIVARASGSERIGYGNALLAVAEMMLAPNHVSGVAFLTRTPELVRRISLIAGYNRRSRLSTLVCAPFIVGLAGVGLTDGVPRPPSPAQAATPSQPAQSPTVKAKAIDQKNPARTLRIRVAGPDDKPLAGAKIFANIVTKDRKIVNQDYFSNADGWATVELPAAGTDILKLWASKDGYVKWFASWWPEQQFDGRPIPSDYTFHLQKATLIGGVVMDESGKPIEGVKVQVTLVQPAATLHIDPRKNRHDFADMWLATGNEAKTTDAQGRWALDNVPAGDVEVHLMLSHPDYISDYNTQGRLQEAQNINMRSLRNRDATIVMRRGIKVTGFVIDGDGQEVKDAVVTWGDDPSMFAQHWSQQVHTNANGHYQFPAMGSGPLTMTVVATGWAPVQEGFDITPAHSSASFQLQRGKTTRIRFVDELGTTIPEVSVQIRTWRGGKVLYNYRTPDLLDNRIPNRADVHGIYQWTWAPHDPVTYSFYKEGYQRVAEIPITANGEEHVITLRR
jgi:hypothetical protein